MPRPGELTQQAGHLGLRDLRRSRSAARSAGRSTPPRASSVSPDGANVYAAAFDSGAVDVFNRNTDLGRADPEGAAAAGCVTSSRTPDCTRGRTLSRPARSSSAPTAGIVYAAAFGSNAVGVFKRVNE